VLEKTGMGDERTVVSGIMCVFFAGIVAFALSWSRSAGLAPLAVGIPGLVLSLLQLADDMRASRRTPMRIPKAAFILVGWLTGFVLVTMAIGLLAGAFVSIAAFLRLHERDGYSFAFAVAAVYTATAWVLFDVVLELSLFPGILFT
jgi:hypothetical protein